MKIGYKELLDKAMSEVETLTMDDAIALHNEGEAQFVDLRDIRELKLDGKIPEAFHTPRGMLEFWIDPDSPYFKKVFGQDTKICVLLQVRVAVRAGYTDCAEHGP